MNVDLGATFPLSSGGAMHTREKLVLALLAIVAIMALPELIQYCTPRISWDKFSTEGRQLVQFGEPDKAVKFYKTLIRETIVSKGVRDPGYIAALEGLAMAYQKQGMYLSAEDQFNEALHQLNKAWIPDRCRIRETMHLMAAMYEKSGDSSKLEALKVRERSLNTWCQWFWSCFVVTFMAESLYMAVVLARPGDLELHHFQVEHGWLYSFACLVGTVGMIRGLIMAEVIWYHAIIVATVITGGCLPLVFACVFVFARQLAQQDSRRLLEAPQSRRTRNA